jgi:hypothetical protein
MHGKRKELKVNAFSKYVKGSANKKRIAKTLPYHPSRIKVTLADGSTKYVRQSRKEAIRIIAEGASKK